MGARHEQSDSDSLLSGTDTDTTSSDGDSDSGVDKPLQRTNKELVSIPEHSI